MPATILKNTLLSRSSIEHMLALPRRDDVYGNILEVLKKFQDIRKFASEIHTEIHLVKPILKTLGYAYESKPKFFEDQVKGPDVTLFATEEDRERSSQFWGTKEYYDNTLGILLLKRYGRNLKEGISGFLLRIRKQNTPLSNHLPAQEDAEPLGDPDQRQTLDTDKETGAIRKRYIELDIESALFDDNDDALHVFYHLFSQQGLQQIVPRSLEGERKALIEALTQKKGSFQRSTKGLKKKVDVYLKAADTFSQIVHDRRLPATEVYLSDRGVALEQKEYGGGSTAVNEYDAPDIFSYLFLKKPPQAMPGLEEVFLGDGGRGYTKDEILSLKILDMTPGMEVLRSSCWRRWHTFPLSSHTRKETVSSRSGKMRLLSSPLSLRIFSTE